jgi:HlyD family secretion protein
VLVEIATVTRGPLRVTVEDEGKTRLKERYVVSAPVTGRMERIDADEGDVIRQGQVLTIVVPLPATFLDARTRAQADAELNAALARVEAAAERVHAAKANADLANAELKRVTALLKTGDVARSRYDAVVAEDQRAAATLAEANSAALASRAEVNRARVALEQPVAAVGSSASRFPVTAPATGRVLRVIRDSEGPVIAGEPLLEIGNARALEVEVEVLSADAVKLAPASRVLFTRWGGEMPLEGVVHRIEPVGRTKISALGVEEQRVPVIALITSPESHWTGLGAGYRVEASFILWEGTDILQVPSSAAFRHDNGWAVFVVDGRLADRRAVTLGHRSGLQIQVIDGLKPGDTVIAHPDNSIKDGTLVDPHST